MKLGYFPPPYPFWTYGYFDSVEDRPTGSCRPSSLLPVGAVLQLQTEMSPVISFRWQLCNPSPEFKKKQREVTWGKNKTKRSLADCWLFPPLKAVVPNLAAHHSSPGRCKKHGNLGAHFRLSDILMWLVWFGAFIRVLIISQGESNVQQSWFWSWP